MATKSGKFTFTVPKDSPVENERGVKQEKTFSYTECETDASANEVLAEKSWTLRELVNEKLYSNARANAYQQAIAPHKKSEVSAEDIVERMVRDFMRVGVSETQARDMIAAATSK